MERKQKGLCFKCGGPFHPKHQCPDKHLRVLITEDDETEEGGERVLVVEVEEEESEGELSILSLFQLGQLGEGKPQSFQLKGIVSGVPLVILVDSRATHNFIDKKLVHKMSWVIATLRVY